MHHFTKRGGQPWREKSRLRPGRIRPVPLTGVGRLALGVQLTYFMVSISLDKVVSGMTGVGEMFNHRHTSLESQQGGPCGHHLGGHACPPLLLGSNSSTLPFLSLSGKNKKSCLQDPSIRFSVDRTDRTCQASKLGPPFAANARLGGLQPVLHGLRPLLLVLVQALQLLDLAVPVRARQLRPGRFWGARVPGKASLCSC